MHEPDGRGRVLAVLASFEPGPLLIDLRHILDGFTVGAQLRRVAGRPLAAEMLDPAGPWATDPLAALVLSDGVSAEVLASLARPCTLPRLIIDARTTPGPAVPAGGQLTSINLISQARRAGLTQIVDAAGARAGLPLTPGAQALAALAIARWADLNTRQPIKMIVVDGDQTLWGGILGEDGPEGIWLSPGHVALQARLAAAADAGTILAMASRNEAADVLSLLDQRPDFRLRQKHFLAHRIGWRPKAETLGEMAAQFGVADDAVLFLDDSAVECAAMRAARPGVLCVRVPGESELDAFVDGLWPLDLRPGTAADAQRVNSYRAEAARQDARATAATLEDFFNSLDLKILIRAATANDRDRVAQMSQRTNQFNASLRRLDVGAVDALLADPSVHLDLVEVADRFGDYGTVGLMGYQHTHNQLRADLFLLSCRALGRGVEHEMLRYLGRAATMLGDADIVFALTDGPRNQPLRAFFEAMGVDRGGGDETGRIPAVNACGAIFDPASAASDTTPDDDAGQGAHARMAVPAADRGVQYETAARLSTQAEHLVTWLGGTIKPRPDIATAFRGPVTVTERRVHAIWLNVLRLSDAGIDDTFTALGGRSFDLVRVQSQLLRAGFSVDDLGPLFQYPTIAALAAFFDGPATRAVNDTAADRAQQMRAARDARRAQRGAAI